MKKTKDHLSTITGLGKGAQSSRRCQKKRLIFDIAKKTEEVFSHAISDLEACHDMQLHKM